MKGDGGCFCAFWGFLGELLGKHESIEDISVDNRYGRYKVYSLAEYPST